MANENEAYQTHEKHQHEKHQHEKNQHRGSKKKETKHHGKKRTLKKKHLKNLTELALEKLVKKLVKDLLYLIALGAKYTNKAKEKMTAHTHKKGTKRTEDSYEQDE